jgi:hypothetical protein
MFKKIALLGIIITLAACEPAADKASKNLSKAADNFEIDRRIVFINGITGENMLMVEGKCSLGNHDSHRKLSITCKTGPEAYEKHYLGLSDNVTFIAEQLETTNVSTFHTRITFRPQSILPDIDFQGSMEDLTQNQNTDG